MSIPNLFNKIKREFNIDKVTILYLCIIIGVGICCFCLGRMSISSINGTHNNFTKNATDDNSLLSEENNLNISNNSETILDNTKEGSNSQEKKYVASKNGKMFYSVGCSGAKRIKPENQVWFASALDAEKSGFALSTTCK